MEFDKLLENCSTIENSLMVLFKTNAAYKKKLNILQGKICETTQVDLAKTVDRELELRTTLENLRHSKNELDTSIKQYSSVNGKLSDLVSKVQKANNSRNDDDSRQIELYARTSFVIQEYETSKLEFVRLYSSFEILLDSLQKDSNEIENLVKTANDLVVNLCTNDSFIRVLEQQNKYAEKQFDLILNQLPWEPLTKQCLEELRKTDNKIIRDVVDLIEVQSNEIEELTDSLNGKKKRKLELLKQLAEQLSNFVARRGEAISMNNHENKDKIYASNID